MTFIHRRTDVADTLVSTHPAEQASSPADLWAVPGQNHPRFEQVDAEPSAPRDALDYDLRLTQRDLSSPLAATLARLQPVLGSIFADPTDAEAARTESAGPDPAAPDTAGPEPAGLAGSVALSDLQAAISALGTDDLLRTIRDAEAVTRHLDALRVHLAGEVDTRSHRNFGTANLAKKLGCRNGVEVLQRLTHNSSATIKNHFSIARALRSTVSPSGAVIAPRFAATADAFTAGLIGLDTTGSIVRGLRPASAAVRPELLALAERCLVESATGRAETGFSWCHADETREQARRALAYIDEDGSAPDEDEPLRQRGLTLGAMRDGLVPVSGNLLPEVAAQLKALCDAFLNPRTHADTNPSTTSLSTDKEDGTGTGTAAEAGAGTVPADTRTYAQKMHDLFGIALDIAARCAEAPTVGGNAPVVSVSVRLSDLTTPTRAGHTPDADAPPGSPYGFPPGSPPGFSPGSPSDSLSDSPPGTGFGYIDGLPDPVSLATVRRFACAGGIQKILLSDTGRILQLGSPERCFTPQQRKAISLRDGGCVIPGCMIPAGWCEVHHVIPHSHGGPTHTDNGVLLCAAHHRTIDHSGWQITMPGGVPHLTPPRWIDPDQKTHRHVNPRQINHRHVNH